MGLGSRTARQHDTVAAHTAGVDPSEYWEYQPGQSVMTVDGFSGSVASVSDGPLSGTESYNVILDGGLGGGEYTASQLQPKHDPAVKTAADDYPELGTILQDRPDIAPNTRWASLSTTASDDEHYEYGVEQCPECGSMVDTNRGPSMEDHLADEHSKDPEDYDHGPNRAWERKQSSFRDGPGEHDHSQPKGEHGIESFTELEPNDGAASGVDEHGHLTWGGNSPGCRDTNEYSMFGQNDAVEKQASFFTADELREEGRKALAEMGLTPEQAQEQMERVHGGREASFDPWGIVTEAAGDPDFRFHVTAAWADVRNKAKRIRSEGGVHVTLATEGTIVGEVKGDHHVYETGIQRLPGRTAIQGWSCGCKWGSYHWGADDDFSRFAGRMCSHALALQYEAQSRGMFGRDVRPDDQKPSWVPRMVVVKHDIDSGRNLSAPATPARGDYGLMASLTVAGSLLTRLRGREAAEDVALAFSSAGLDFQAALRAEAAVNDAWGEPSPSPSHYQPGPTKPRDPGENPASAGWASAPEPEEWGQAGPSGMNHMVSSLQDDEAIFEPEMGKEAFLPLLIPLAEGLAGAGAGAAAAGAGAEVAGAGAARALVPKVLEKAAPVVKQIAPRVMTHELLKGDHQEGEGPQGPGSPAAPQPGPAHGPDDEDNNPLNYGARAELHEEPEGALPSTDGDLEPEDPSFVSTGSVQDIVAQFQATAGARALEGAGGAPAPTAAPSGDRDGMNIAAAAKMFLETGQQPSESGLQTTALKEFTLAEQQKIINEGATNGVRAGNLDRLDIKGTHYAELEAALSAVEAAEEDQDSWLS